MRALRQLPNQLTLLRIILNLPLWYFALTGQRFAFAITFIIAGLTDFLDGFLARHFRQVNALGAKLDSWADNIIAVSSLAWIWLLAFDVLDQYKYLIGALYGSYVLVRVTGFIKFKEFPCYHLYTHKFAAISLYVLFPVILLYGPAFFFICVSTLLVAVSLIEELILTLTHDTIEADKLSIFRKIKRP